MNSYSIWDNTCVKYFITHVGTHRHNNQGRAFGNLSFVLEKKNGASGFMKVGTNHIDANELEPHFNCGK